MVAVAEHLGLAELQAGWRESKDATLARHYQVIWLLAEGRSCAEVARLTGFVRRWIEELAARYNRFGPSSLGDRRRGNGAKPKILTPEVLAMLHERVKTAHGRRTRACRGGRAARLVRQAEGPPDLRLILLTAPRHRLDDPAPAAAARAGGDAGRAGDIQKNSPKPSPRRRSAIPAR
jgi:transposase